jgi:hypothetical protein
MNELMRGSHPYSHPMNGNEYRQIMHEIQREDGIESATYSDIADVCYANAEMARTKPEPPVSKPAQTALRESHGERELRAFNDKPARAMAAWKRTTEAINANMGDRIRFDVGTETVNMAVKSKADEKRYVLVKHGRLGWTFEPDYMRAHDFPVMVAPPPDALCAAFLFAGSLPSPRRSGGRLDAPRTRRPR